MNDIRAAAERMRWCDRTLHPDYIATEQEDLDLLTLANAYLAEHPADDDEPITEDWVATILYKDADGTNYHLGTDGGGNHFLEFHLKEGWRIEFIAMNTQPKTRGDVRRLMKYLGVSPLSARNPTLPQTSSEEKQ